MVHAFADNLLLNWGQVSVGGDGDFGVVELPFVLFTQFAVLP